MNDILLISLILMILLLIAAVRYFQAACQLSVAENWLLDFADLRNWRKNRALTFRLFRAIVGRERVVSATLLKKLRRRFALLLMLLSMNVVWTIGLFLSVLQAA